MVYVGANDGMLHAFKVSDGSELWAYIPSNLWEKLEHLADPEYCHEYFVDLSPKVIDIYDGSNWKTVLIGGQRGGGNTYFALDITDPDNPGILWELTHQNLGETWSIPATGKVNIGGSDKWVAFVGSGFENNNTKGYLFVVDINSGAILWSLNVSSDTNNCLTSPTAVDTGGDGYIDTAYTGDLKGKIWKFDVSDTDTVNWSGSLLFHAVDNGGDGQPITARPVVSFDKNWNPVIYFGTGKFYDDTDKTTTQQQSFYGIIDDGSGTITKADHLVDQTTTIHPLTGHKGWYINLSVSSPSERVISEATVVAKVVFFTSFIPDDDPCAYGGFSYLWAVKYLTGGAPDEPVLTDLEEGERRKDLGSGLPSTPVVSIKHEKVIIQTSDATIHTEGVTLPDLGVKLRSWREVF
jgi:type IV pilus assembly protein PilY1